MVIKLTVPQTFGSFRGMRAGSAYFYYWHLHLMNIINCFNAQIQYLQENDYTRIAVHSSTCCVERAGHWQKDLPPNPCTFFHSSPQRVPDLSCYAVHLWEAQPALSMPNDASSVKSCDLLPPWLHNKKGDQSEVRGCGRVWETVYLITMAYMCM